MRFSPKFKGPAEMRHRRKTKFSFSRVLCAPPPNTGGRRPAGQSRTPAPQRPAGQGFFYQRQSGEQLLELLAMVAGVLAANIGVGLWWLGYLAGWV